MLPDVPAAPWRWVARERTCPPAAGSAPLPTSQVTPQMSGRNAGLTQEHSTHHAGVGSAGDHSTGRNSGFLFSLHNRQQRVGEQPERKGFQPPRVASEDWKCVWTTGLSLRTARWSGGGVCVQCVWTAWLSGEGCVCTARWSRGGVCKSPSGLPGCPPCGWGRFRAALGPQGLCLCLHLLLSFVSSSR